MATKAHALYCFEILNAELNGTEAMSLEQVEEHLSRYQNHQTTTNTTTSRSSSKANRHLAATQIDGQGPSPSSHGSSTPSASSSNVSSSISSPPSASSASQSAANQKSNTRAEARHPLFVTWNITSRHGSKNLRGCIGTFEAQPLEHGLKSFALTSAFDDTRFDPISLAELSELECDVTLLTDFEPASSPTDWEVGKHGIRIAFTHRSRRYGSTYLPDVAREQGWGKTEALVSLMRKAGWNGRKDEWMNVGDLKVTRYQGLKVGVSFEEWRDWREWVMQQQ